MEEIGILPDYTETIIKYLQEECGVIEKQQIYRNTEIGVPTICLGTAGTQCRKITVKAGLISTGNMHLNAQHINVGKEKPVVLCSKNGNISIWASKFSGNGLIYAPNGTVTIYASDFDYSGTIFARKIKIHARQVEINRQKQNAVNK